MNQQHSTVFSLPVNLYAAGSPVAILTGELLKDNQTEAIFTRLDLCNIQPKPIVAAKVRIAPFDSFHAPTANPFDYQYLDIRAERDMTFGGEILIPMADPYTRALTVSVVEVSFADGTVWNVAQNDWEALPQPQVLAKKLGDWELARQYAMEAGENSVYWPEEVKDLWYCSCGSLNRAGEDCHICGRSLFEFQMMDLDQLEKDRDERLAEEQQKAAEEKQKAAEEKQKAEEAAARKKKRKKRKRTMVWLLVLALAAAVVFGMTGAPEEAPAMTAPPAEAPAAAPATEAAPATTAPPVPVDPPELIRKTTDGNPVGQPVKLYASKRGDVTVHSYQEQLLDNGYVRFTVEFTAPKNRNVSFFDPPDGKLFMILPGKRTTGEKQTLIIDVKAELVAKTGTITIKFYGSGAEGDYMFVTPRKYSQWEIDKAMEGA